MDENATRTHRTIVWLLVLVHLAGALVWEFGFAVEALVATLHIVHMHVARKDGV